MGSSDHRSQVEGAGGHAIEKAWPPVLPSIRFARPIGTLDTVRAVLDCTENEAVDLVQDKALWAFNVCRRESHRSEYRVFLPSLAAYATGERCFYSRGFVIDWVLGRRTGDLFASELARRLVVSASHVANLVAQGNMMACIGGNGVNRSAYLVRETVVTWLSTRALW